MRLREALINRNYARLWYGQAVSTVGDYVFDTTLLLWVATVLAKGKPWAPFAVSGVVLAVGAAVLLVGPFAGVFVDRWNRRVIMLRTEVVRSALVLLLSAVSLLPARDLPVGVWLTLIYAVVFVLNAAGQFFGPARFATIGDIVTGQAARAQAAGLGQATSAAASIIGPPLAALLLFTAGLQWALLVNGLSYLVSYVAIRSLDITSSPAKDGLSADPGRKAAGLRREFAAGLRFFSGNRFLVTLLLIAVICQCGTGAMNALDVFFVTRNLHASVHLYGFLGAAFGLGAIGGGLAAGWVVQWLGARRTTWICLLLSGALIIGYSRQTNFWSGTVLLFVTAVPVAMLSSAMTPLLLATTPKEYLGRMLAVFNPVNQLASMLSVLVAGWLASAVLQNFHGSLAGLRFGPIDAIFAVSGLLAVIAGCYALIALPAEADRPATNGGSSPEPRVHSATTTHGQE
jgi:MFS family permease